MLSGRRNDARERSTPAPSAAARRVTGDAPKPDAIPRPTYVPAAMAFGITLFFWGIITSPVVLGVGLRRHRRCRSSAGSERCAMKNDESP